MHASHKRLGLGTFPFAGVFSEVNAREAENIVSRFLELGGYYIDTAPVYALGNVESVLGKILSSFRRDKFYIGTKCGYIWGQDNKPVLSGKKGDVISECEKSLKRLGLSEIDLYMSHVPDIDTPFEETMDALISLKSQGKIKEIGVSNVDLEQLKKYNSSGQVNFVENRYSLLNQSFSADFFAYCKKNKIGLIVYQVIERGLLTDKAIQGLSIRDNDLRNKKPEFAPPIRSTIGLWVKEYLKPIADRHNVNIASLAIWWAMQQPEIVYPIFGATSVEQVHDNFKTINMSLPKHVVTEVQEAYQRLESEIREKHGSSVRKFMGLI